MNFLERNFLKLFPSICSKVTDRLRIPRHYMNALKHSVMMNYLRRTHADIIEKYKAKADVPLQPIGKDATIFVMWMQGEESMPPLVKTTYASILQYAGDHPVVLLTQENIREYLTKSELWDEENYNYLAQEKISHAHFADLARMCVLSTYGGIWIDATILLNCCVDDFITEQLAFFSGRRPGWKDNSIAACGRWTSYFFACGKSNPLVGFMYELMHAHLLHEQRFVEYFMMDNSFALAYASFPYIREMVDASPAFSQGFDAWFITWERPWEGEEAYRAWRDTSPFFKLTYKGSCTLRTKDGRPTIYAHMVGEDGTEIVKPS